MYDNRPIPKIRAVAVALLGMAALRCSQAALCDGFATEAECTGKVVDTGNCVWQADTSTCESDGTGLPPEVAAITAVEGPSGEEPMYPEPTDDAFCMLPADTGLCRGFFPSWYWDSEAKSCKEFTYGGCPGNDNRFETPEACVASSERFCSAAASPSFYGSALAAVILLLASSM